MAETLKAERAARGLTQAELAEAAGLSLNAVGNYEKRERVPDVERLARIAAVLGLSLSEFFARAEIRLR